MKSGIDFILEKELKFGDIFLIDNIEYIFISYALTDKKETKFKYIFAIEYKVITNIYKNKFIYLDKIHRYKRLNKRDKTFLLKYKLEGIDFTKNLYGIIPVTYESYKEMIREYVRVNKIYAQIDEPKRCHKNGETYIIIGLQNITDLSFEVCNVYVVVENKYKKKALVRIDEIEDNIEELSLFSKYRYIKIAKKLDLKYNVGGNLIKEFNIKRIE